MSVVMTTVPVPVQGPEPDRPAPGLETAAPTAAGGAPDPAVTSAHTEHPDGPVDAVLVPPEDDATGAEAVAQAAMDDFERRVEDRIRQAMQLHGLRRVVHTPAEIARAREVERQASVWVPMSTFAVTSLCAVAAIGLAVRFSSDPTRSSFMGVLVSVATVALIAAGFGALVRSQAYFDQQRPGGRLVRSDVADAYETVRDAPAVFLELGVPPAALSRVADLLPVAERLVDALAAHEASGGARSRDQAAYVQMIRMAAEVTVLTDLAEERAGRRSLRRRDRAADVRHGRQPQPEPVDVAVQSLADVAAIIAAPSRTQVIAELAERES